MARVPNINDFNNEREFRNNVLKMDSQSGDTYLVSHKEVRDVLSEYVTQELSLHTLQVSNEHKKQIEKHLRIQFDSFVDDMTDLLNERIIDASEKIIEKMLDCYIQDEIKRRVDERLQKIKDSL